MSSVPSFEAATAELQQLLASLTLSTRVAWLFREDVWFLRYDRAFVTRALHADNLRLASQVYVAGSQRGLVEVVATIQFGGLVGATVWYPHLPDEQAQGWSQGLKVSVRSPLPLARTIPGSIWPFLRLAPAFRRYQRFNGFIPTRTWAASCAPSSSAHGAEA